MLNGKGSQAHIDNRCQQIIGAMDDCSSGSAIKNLNMLHILYVQSQIWTISIIKFVLCS